MKKLLIALGVIAGIVILFVMWANGHYNKAINYQENVDKSWANVVTDYQRRADLVPQLVETVKGAAENEKGILTAVTNARAGISNAKTPEDIELMGKEINSAINLAFEAYPQIRSTQNFSELQAQLEGTENRISVSRKAYNESVQVYNRHIRGFFRKFAINIFAEEDEFPRKEMFEAVTENVEQAPKVEF
ncbi:MAG: LemA family protein [Bacteroidales bacterium]|jgi:LemA protein|nr:LemA family protein [Bacteroidales bacterium]